MCLLVLDSLQILLLLLSFIIKWTFFLLALRATSFRLKFADSGVCCIWWVSILKVLAWIVVLTAEIHEIFIILYSELSDGIFAAIQRNTMKILPCSVIFLSLQKSLSSPIIIIWLFHAREKNQLKNKIFFSSSTILTFCYAFFIRVISSFVHRKSAVFTLGR